MNYKAKVTTPHTWNVDDEVMKHRGEAVYETTIYLDESLNDKKAFISFNAVYHSAKVYINDIFAEEHSRSGFTPFKFDITDKIIFGKENAIKVIVDNTHIDEMLPHMNDFDWADDGGIIRKAELNFVENNAVEYIRVEENIKEINN
ncbi:MAG: beta galactosidase jelly roll domain-containing protein, partial [Eubacterium sp.]|nr:beta galactosidase jelly roll domain-containing protein [Eubacterium sp.]